MICLDQGIKKHAAGFSQSSLVAEIPRKMGEEIVWLFLISFLT